MSDAASEHAIGEAAVIRIRTTAIRSPSIASVALRTASLWRAMHITSLTLSDVRLSRAGRSWTRLPPG